MNYDEIKFVFLTMNIGRQTIVYVIIFCNVNQITVLFNTINTD